MITLCKITLKPCAIAGQCRQWHCSYFPHLLTATNTLVLIIITHILFCFCQLPLKNFVQYGSCKKVIITEALLKMSRILQSRKLETRVTGCLLCTSSSVLSERPRSTVTFAVWTLVLLCVLISVDVWLLRGKHHPQKRLKTKKKGVTKQT